ncbi:MAG: dTDP-4-dehydrorhamnose 3,5-epimerase [Pseudomonadota bacterium]
MVSIQKTSLQGILVVEPKRFGDDRGFFSETYRQDWALLENSEYFQQDNHAFSATPNTVRGLHFQYGRSTQAKLLRVVTGAILDVAVDIRAGSPTYGQAVAVELSAQNGKQLFVPHGFAHGYATLTPDTHVLYKVDRPYDPQSEGAVLWSDPALDIPWPKMDLAPSLSDKDKDAPLLKALDTPFIYDEASPYHCHCK